MANDFNATRNMFREYINYTDPLSYEEWLAAADDHKAAIIYVQFFDQITLAWYKVKSFYASEEEGVETALQYIMKNVPLIRDDKSKFSCSYIYRIMFNCLYCICHDRQVDKLRWALESSNIAEGADGEVDMFDFIPDNSNIEDAYINKMQNAEFWKMFEDMGEDTMTVIAYLQGDIKLPLGFGYKKKKIIIQQLQEILKNSEYPEMYGLIIKD